MILRALILIGLIAIGVLPSGAYALSGNKAAAILNPEPALDRFGVAVAAYSVRLLRREYTGPLVNLSCSTGPITSDFYPNGSGDLNQTAILAFCPVGTLTVTKWYDQTGNGNTCAQATVGNQPLWENIVTGLNNRPSLQVGTSVTRGCSASSSSSVNNLFTGGGYLIGVVNIVGTVTTTGELVSTQSGTGGYSFTFQTGPQLGLVQVATTGGQWTATAPSSSSHVVDASYSAASVSNVPTITVDGVSQSFATATQPTGTIAPDTGNTLGIGNRNSTSGTPSAARAWPGQFAEIILYKAIPTASQAAQLRQNQGQYFGITIQ